VLLQEGIAQGRRNAVMAVSNQAAVKALLRFTAETLSQQYQGRPEEGRFRDLITALDFEDIEGAEREDEKTERHPPGDSKAPRRNR
jgi:hypothetical protein